VTPRIITTALIGSLSSRHRGLEMALHYGRNHFNSNCNLRRICDPRFAPHDESVVLDQRCKRCCLASYTRARCVDVHHQDKEFGIQRIEKIGRAAPQKLTLKVIKNTYTNWRLWAFIAPYT